MNLDDFKKLLAKEAGLSDPDRAKAAGLCCSCGKPAIERCYSEAGRREYRISGLCEVCFDEATKEDD